MTLHVLFVVLLCVSQIKGRDDNAAHKQSEPNILKAFNQGIADGVRQVALETSHLSELWLSSLLLAEWLMCPENLKSERADKIKEHLGLSALSTALTHQIVAKLGPGGTEKHVWIGASIDIVFEATRDLAPLQVDYVALNQGAALRDLSRKVNSPLANGILESKKTINIVLSTTVAKSLPFIGFVESWKRQQPTESNIAAAAKITLFYKVAGDEVLAPPKMLEIRLLYHRDAWLVVE